MGIKILTEYKPNSTTMRLVIAMNDNLILKHERYAKYKTKYTLNEK